MKRKALFSAILAVIFMVTSCKQKAINESSNKSNDQLSVPMSGNFMGVDYELTTAPNGALVNKNILTDYKMYQAPLTSNFVKKQVVKVAEGIYSIQGVYVGNVTAIETKNGIVLYDTGEKISEGQEVLALLKTVTNKPVIAIIYSHSHYIYGSAPIKAAYPNVKVIAHAGLHNNVMTNFGVGGSPELSSLLINNAAQQFHMYLPREGSDAPFGGLINMVEIAGYVPPTQTVKNNETINIDGVDFQFFTDYDNDTKDCLLVWLPQKKAVLNNLLWGVMPNIYSLRGSNYRDPETIIKGLYRIRDMKAEYIMGVHSMPEKGVQQCRDLVLNTADFYILIQDQTMRAMLLGMAPQDLGQFVKMPKHMKETDYLCETYGVMESFPESVYQYTRGWFDGDAANIFKVPRKAEAENLIKAIGGPDRVMKLADQAIKDNDQVWALKLVNYLYITDPNNQQYRTKKAQLLYQMGIVLEAQNARSWCLTQAYALMNKIQLPRLFLPKELVEKMPVDMLVSQYKVRIDPKKAENTDYLLNLVVDGKNTVGLHCRRGVVEFIPDVSKYDRKADATLSMNRASLNDLFLNTKSLSEILSAKGTSINGDKAKLEQFLSYFDEIFSPALNQAVPVVQK